MGPWPKRIMTVFIFLPLTLWGQEEEPYWRKNKNLYEKILNQRKIVVSVKTEGAKPARSFRMLGAGVVNAPLRFAVQEVKKFENLPKTSSYFKKVVHNEKEQKLYLHMEAMGMRARMMLQYKWTDNFDKNQAQMDWLVTWGLLKGMEGNFIFREVPGEPGKTEVALWNSIKNMESPLPDFLMGFTLEVIGEKVAQKMRSYVESQYRDSQEKVKDNGKIQ